jgi:ABC-type multidrug transport system fused ATPase/permease subunit
MPEEKSFLKKTIDFFATRFVLREHSLWRVLGLVKEYKSTIILANVLLTIASIIGTFVLVSLTPLFQFTLNPDRGSKDGSFSAKRPAAAETRTTQTLALAEGGPTTLTLAGARTAALTLADNRQTSLTLAGARLTLALAGARESSLTLTVATPKKPEEDPKKSHIRKSLDKVPFLKHLDGKLQRASSRFEELYGRFMQWGHDEPRKFILVFCGLLLTMMLMQGAIEFVGDSMLGKIGIRVTGKLLRDVYGNVLAQEMKFFDQTSTGTLINTCYREVFEVRNIVVFLASTRLMLPIQMVALFCGLMINNWRFTLLLCGLLPVVILPTMLLTRSLKKAIRDMMQGEARPIDLMTEAFHGIKAIKAFNTERYEMSQMDPAVTDYETFANKRRSSQAMIDPMVDILNTLVIMMVFVALFLFMPAVGRDSESQQKMQAELLTFMAMVQRFYKPFRQLMTMNLSMQRASMAANRIFKLLDRKPEIVDASGAVDFPKDWREIRFDDVYLAYQVFYKGEPRLRKALRGVKLTIRRGEAVAFVGPNGAGKSSVVNLLCRLYDPTGGAVYFDDVPLKKVHMASLREKICLITQHPILFNRSVADNITFGLEGISQERIEEAARAVNAHTFIANLPDGYNSDVGEQGKLLSGGERQKITLARAFVRRPDVLILDEPTTGLDKETTQEFLELISELKRHGITIIYITHEHTHLTRFDRVLQLTPERKVIEVTAADAAQALIQEVLSGGKN